MHIFIDLIASNVLIVINDLLVTILERLTEESLELINADKVSEDEQLTVTGHVKSQGTYFESRVHLEPHIQCVILLWFITYASKL